MQGGAEPVVTTGRATPGLMAEHERTRDESGEPRRVRTRIGRCRTKRVREASATTRTTGAEAVVANGRRSDEQVFSTQGPASCRETIGPKPETCCREWSGFARARSARSRPVRGRGGHGTCAAHMGGARRRATGGQCNGHMPPSTHQPVHSRLLFPRQFRCTRSRTAADRRAQRQPTRRTRHAAAVLVISTHFVFAQALLFFSSRRGVCRWSADILSFLCAPCPRCPA